MTAAFSGNACQPAAGISCGACCGLFNLDLGDDRAEAARERALLLAERSRAFARVRFDRPADFVAYRAAREGREGAIPRHSSETYVCPFYGPLTPPEPEQFGEATPPSAGVDAPLAYGCMTHPLRTGLAHTQNFSFYGASICQAYDCRNKDQDPTGRYSRLLVQYVLQKYESRAAGAEPVVPDISDERYTRLMADLPLFAFLERVPGLLDRLVKAASAGLEAGLSGPEAGTTRGSEAGVTGLEDKVCGPEAGTTRGSEAGATGWSLTPLREFALLASARLRGRHTARVTSFEIELSRYPDLRTELGALLNDALLSEDEPDIDRHERERQLRAECDEIYTGLCP